MKKTITITVAGICCTGKSLIKYQIAKHLQSLGLKNVKVVEEEMNAQAIIDRTNMPSKYVISMNQAEVNVVVEEKQLVRDLFANDGSYRIPKSKGAKK